MAAFEVITEAGKKLSRRGSRDVGQWKILAFEEEGLPCCFCQSVAEAVAEIQSRCVTALSITPKSVSRCARLFLVYGNDLDSCAGHEQVEIAQPVVAATALDHDRGFDECGCRDQTRCGAFDA